jgi:signal transduction histidine kinase
MKFDFKPNLEVIGDKVILQQILYNLLSNAEKFTFQGSITLSVAHEDLSDNQIKLKFKISDTGIGIEEDMKEVIFEKFKQLPSIKQHKLN